jgi:Superfamily I DNA and RNA helicases
MELTSNQYRAVTHLQGPCMVLAGPGSGKTFIIVRRIEHLIVEHKVNPEAILVVTFTKAAAKEMKERFLALPGRESSQVVFGTFHSIFFGILRQSAKQMNLTIMTEAQKRTLLEQLLIERKCSYEAEEVADILKDIGVWKNQNMQQEAYELESSLTKEEFEELLLAYEAEKKRENKIDFEDILIYTYQLLRDNPKQLEMWRERFRYILIDEFQDINPLQYQTMKLLCGQEKNIFLVGDDDQSIYSFRGASPEIMLDFETEYPEGVKIILDRNFRSPSSIVRRSQKVISNNEERFLKKMLAKDTRRSPIVIRKFQNVIDESYYILQEIKKRNQEGVALHHIAILARSQKDVLSVVDTLNEYNVPYFMREKHISLYEHFIAKDILSYLKLAIGPMRRVDLLRVGNRPSRYLRRDSLENEMISFEKLYQFYEDKSWMYPYLQSFEEDLRFLKQLPPYAAIQYIYQKIGYADYLVEYAKKRQMSITPFLDILKKLKMRARKYASIEEWVLRMEKSQEDEGKAAQKRELLEGKVHISTIHASKGLEYDTVFLIQANEGTMPYKQAVSPKAVEEERRIFYVAITRAKVKLYISYVKEKNGKDAYPSRFVTELKN